MLSIFNLFRRGEGGGISVRDVATYTTSVFRAMYKLQPSLEGEVIKNECLIPIEKSFVWAPALVFARGELIWNVS